MRLEATVPMERSRFLVVHYHIFKNGGSTIESILEREFSDGYATLHGRSPETVLDASDLMQFFQHHPRVQAVSSHHLRYPKPLDRQSVFFDCCFLRHPLSRLQSCYNHFRRPALDHPYAAWARPATSRQFIRRLIEEAPHMANNVQVMQLANAGAFTRPADEEDLDRATAVVRDMAIPGLVEMFDESLVSGEYFLRPAFPTLRMEYTPHNVNSGGRPAAPESAGYWIDLWGRPLYQTLARMNALDIELVARARREILRRLDLIPRVAERLMEFRVRCARLSTPAMPYQPAAQSASAVA